MLVAIDSAFVERELVEVAAGLAGPLGARLVGLFVENENLIRLAGLPFATELSLAGAAREINPEDVLREMRAQAKAARSLVQEVATAIDVEWAFETARGQPLMTLAEAAEERDIIVVQASPGSPPQVTDALARLIRMATCELHADILLFARRGRAALAAAELAARGPRGVAAAARAIMEPGRSLVAIDDGTDASVSCVSYARDLARAAGVPFRRLDVREAGSQTACEAARRVGAGLVVADASCERLGGEEDPAQIALAAGCPVLLLGSEHETPEKA